MPVVSMSRAYSWLFGVSLFAVIKHRRERRCWLPVARSETRWGRVRDQTVADAHGPPACALDFRPEQSRKTQSWNRVDRHCLTLTPISQWVDLETLCPNHDF
jgi:hypothetical protein